MATYADYPLMMRALKQMKASYDDFGGMPKQVTKLVGGALDAIDAYVDRPVAEKDAMMAATALYFSTDMTVYKQLPDNVEDYGASVKTILEDAMANPTRPYGASVDLMQIGLALSIPSEEYALAAMKDTRAKLEEFADDPKMLKLAIRKMMEAIDKGQADGALYFTGAQPRLEERAQKVVDSIREATDELVSYMNTLLAPPPATPQKHAPKP